MTRGWTGLRDRFAACSGMGAAVLLAFPIFCPVRAQDTPVLQILVAEPEYLVLRFRSEDDTVSLRPVPSDLTVTQAGEIHDLEELIRFKDQQDVPLNVVVGLGLLRGDARMQRAVRHALRSELIVALDVRRGDQAALMTFAGEVGVRLPFTRDLAGFGGRLTAHAAGTDSMRLRDAIVAGRDLIDQTDPVGISTLILFTDHAADASRIDLWTIQQSVAGSRIPIHLISIGSEEPMPAAIKQLAIESGGSFVRCADDSLAVRRVVRRLARRLQSLYVASLQQPLETGTVDVVYRAGRGEFAASSPAGPWSVRAGTADAGESAPLWLVVGILAMLGAVLTLLMWHTWRLRRNRSSERSTALAAPGAPEGDPPTLTLELLSPHAAAGQFRFDRYPIRLGRNPAAELAFDAEVDRATSWDHARIDWSDHQIVITDQGSTNGTWINGRSTTTALLREGDRLELGTGGPQLRVVSTGAIRVDDETAKVPIPAGDQPGLQLTLIEGARGRRPLDKTYKQRVITLGRDPDSDVGFAEPPHPVVSRHHAEIIWRAGEYHLVDKRATNGTLLDGRRVDSAVLVAGQRITLGSGGPVLRVSFPEPTDHADQRSRHRLAMAAVLTAILAVTAVVWWQRDRATAPVQVESLSETAFVERAVVLFAEAMNNEIDAVPPGMVRNIQAEIARLSRQDRRTFVRVLTRARIMLPEVQGILAEHGLPPELAYIALVESRFDPSARSGAGALGLWQLMPTTARAYGLRVSGDVDERLDPLKSTHAAARYLKRLYLRYGDFMLALAAYNYGPGNINYALDQLLEDDPLRNRSYWYLVRKNLLPRETDEYVHKVISGWLLATYPERFGLPTERTSEESDMG